MPENPAPEPDFRDPSFIENPYPAYARLREGSPVHLSRDGIWWITRHADVSRLNRDGRLGRDLRRWVAYPIVRPYLGESALERCIEQWMFSIDPPEHTRLRRLVAKVFTPARVAEMEATVRQEADRLIEPLVDADEIDFVRAFAVPFPVRVIAGVLGLDLDDYDQLKTWSDAISRVIEPAARRHEKVAADEAVKALCDYLSACVADRRAHRRADLLTHLVEAEEEGDQLGDGELLSNLVLLLVAGYETTTHLLGNAVVALSEHPDELARLRDDPSLVPLAVEEVLRFDGPANVNARVAHEPIDVGGVVIPEGNLVFNMLGAANRDPSVFEDPDRFDVGRSPNPHVTFGGGPHFCVGAPLARLEARVALEKWLPLLERFRVERDGLTRRQVVNLRGWTSVPMRA